MMLGDSGGMEELAKGLLRTFGKKNDMLATVSIVGPSAVAMGFSPVLVGLTICTGTVGLTLPTDAAFWLPAGYNDLTVKEAFAATTYPTTLTGITAFLVILLLNLASGVLPGLF